MPRKKDKFNDKALSRALKAYRQRDPNDEAAIKAVVEAEARHGRRDPVEGKPVRRLGK